MVRLYLETTTALANNVISFKGKNTLSEEPKSSLTDLPTLISTSVEERPNEEHNSVVEGARIVLMQQFFEGFRKIKNHAPQFDCTFNDMQLISEKKAWAPKSTGV
ncbi:hypothetical protein FQA39_LY11614 [Lamprigera yunnana]|nr:hypothetical protein FQA39_LY11614 [Lamprigera yunnana]